MDRINYDKPAYLRNGGQNSLIGAGASGGAMAASERHIRQETSSPTPAPFGEIDSITQQLRDEVNLLGEAIGTLGNRIESVLTPDVPNELGNEVYKTPSTMLGTQIRCVIDDVSRMRCLVGKLINRVGL